MSLEELTQKIKGTTDLRSLVRVMKAFAASNLREYGSSQKALQEYFQTIESSMQAILQFGTEKIELQDKVSSKIGAIVFTAELGLCGQFNHQIVSHFENTFPKEGALLVLGERSKDLLQNRSVEEFISYPTTLDEMALFLQELLSKINLWISQDIHEIHLYYNQLVSPTSYSPTSRRLSPVDKAWFEKLKQKKWISRSLPQFTMPQRQIFSSLIQEYFFISLYQTVVESLMSENVNRWQTMSAAEKHIDDFMVDLKNDYHQQWQELITAEILDIESGFEALKSNSTKINKKQDL